MIGIVILNYISWDDTYGCVQSIINGKNKEKYHIYIVDNNSPNLPNANIKEVLLMEAITFYQSKENRGYSAGNNIGIKMALEDDCKAIIVSNSDIRFHDNSIDGLWESLKNNPDVGIVGPDILLNGIRQGTCRYSKTALKEKYFATTILRKIYPRIHCNYFGLDKNFDKKDYVYNVSGCCFMISNKCAKKIMPLDENTFLFQEEIILGIHMEKNKCKTLYDPSISVTHKHSGSTKHVKAFAFICFVRSEIYYCKYYLHASSVKLFPLYCIRSLSYISRMIVEFDFRKNFKDYIKKTWNYLWNKI